MQEIESRAIVSQQQINVVKAQITARQRDVRLLQLTSNEIGSMPKDTNVYEGVGKMYVSKHPSPSFCSIGLSELTLCSFRLSRFVATPMSAVDKRLSSETAELKSDITNLEKKLHYLETTHKNSRENIEQILKGSAKA